MSMVRAGKRAACNRSDTGRTNSSVTATLMSIGEYTSATLPGLELRGDPLSIAQVHSVANGRQRPTLTTDPAVLARVRSSQEMVDRVVADGQRVYGVTTGFGGMADVAVPGEFAIASQHNLLSFLTAGVGRRLDRRHVRAAMLLRGNMLLRGVSGVRMELVDRLIQFLAVDAVPVVCELGSIGASGDLIPLATLARAITGQAEPCRVQWGEREVGSDELLADLELEPLTLLPKEGLALVNGTSFSSAIAANCVHESRQLCGLSLATNAMMLRALCGRTEPFDAFVHECKPHRGQMWTAQVMRELLRNGTSSAADRNGSDHVQDRYSLRCLPQYVGPIVEGIARVSHVVSTEMNSVTDNPLIDINEEKFYQSGNFLGQYVGMAMDDLRRYLGLLAKHLDVQIAQLVSPEFSKGLPASLQGNAALTYNAGLKGLQITGNSIMPLLTYYGNPLVEHFPTHAEQYNQNINGLSWGSANLAWESVKLFQHYSALALIFAVQALDLRARTQLGHADGRRLLGSLVEPLYEAVYEAVGATPGEQAPLVFDDADQSLEAYLGLLSTSISEQGRVILSIAPVLRKFDEANLAC